MKTAVFWDVKPCGSCRYRHFGRTYRLRHQGTYSSVYSFLRSVLQLLGTANVLKALILFTLMMESIYSSETSALTRATQRHIPERCSLRNDVRLCPRCRRSEEQMWLGLARRLVSIDNCQNHRSSGLGASSVFITRGSK
jgi:hypothetical protein